MKTLVTGGSGFIGSNIVQQLLDHNDEVTILDNLSSGHLPNIENYIKKGEVRFIEADVRNVEAVISACKGQDVVYHLAACVGRQKSIDDPILDSSTNLLGTINVLEGMRQNDVHRIVYSSSAAIFGELVTPVVAENHPQNADTPYGVSKLAAEKMILAYSGIYEIQGICLRYFNIYGKNQRFDLYGNVIPIFAHRIYSKEPITIYGDGTQTRDFVNVKDVANANIIAATSGKETDVYNLGSGESITIHQLATMMQEIAGIHVDIKYEAERPADVKHCKADSSKVYRELGVKAEVALEQGLIEYMQWFQENCV